MNQDHQLSVLRRLKQYHPAVPNISSVDYHHISVEFVIRQDRLDANLTLDADTLVLLTYAEVVAYNPDLEEKIANYGTIIPSCLDISSPESVTIQLEKQPITYYDDATLTDDLMETTGLYVKPQDWTGVFGIYPTEELAEIQSWFNHIYHNQNIEITIATQFNR
jgi:hypothetical protein